MGIYVITFRNEEGKQKRVTVKAFGIIQSIENAKEKVHFDERYIEIANNFGLWDIVKVELKRNY